MDMMKDMARGTAQNFDALRAQMQGFMSSAALQRQPGGHALAMPCWTIIPPRYHAPPPYDVSKHSASCYYPSSENGEYTVKDEYETSWKVDADMLMEHRETMLSVQNRMSEGLAAMSCLRYYEAVSKFDGALSELWECHKNKPLEMFIRIHRGHALVRAAILECPALHGQSTSRLLDDSKNSFSFCIATLRSWDPPLHAFNRSLLFSGLLGLAWILYFRGSMEEAEERIVEAQIIDLDPSHFRADRDIDTSFFQIALQRFKGDMQKFEQWKNKFGNRLSDFDEDILLVEGVDREYEELWGRYTPCVAMTLQSIMHNRYMHYTEAVVKHFLSQLDAGYTGNTWFAVGACRESREAYRCAKLSRSLLVQAAALVGLGNVHMRLPVVDNRKGSNSDSNIEVKQVSDGSNLKFEEAEMHYIMALETYNELGYKEGQRIVQCNLGNLYHKRMDLQQALEQYQKATIYFSGRLYNGPSALLLHLKFAEVHLEMEAWEAAWESLQRASTIAQESERVAVAWLQHLLGSYFLKKGLAKEHMNQGGKAEIEDAKKHFSIAAQHYAEIQVALTMYSPLWVSLFEQQKETYELLLWCLTWQREHESAVEALVWCERGRTRVSMVENWHAFFPFVRDYLTAEVAGALKTTASSSFDSLSFQETWKNLEVLLSKCPLPAATVVEYVLCADFGLLILVLDLPRGKPKMVRVSFEEIVFEGGNLDREKLTTLVTSTISELLPNPRRSLEAENNLTFLYKLLIKPVEKWLKKPKQIIVIPHEVLFRVPFHALIDGESRGEKKYLIQRCPISCAESIRSLLLCSVFWERHRLQPEKGLDLPNGKKSISWLVVGINFHKDATNLKDAEGEAKEVADILSKKLECSKIGSPFLGSRATKDEICKHLKNAVIVHFATHSIITD